MASHDTTTTTSISTSTARNNSAAAAAPPVKACNYCRNSHTACDGERPCRRCVKRGLGDQCCDLVPRKKGRPARNDPRFRPKHDNMNSNKNSSGSGGSSNEDKAERRASSSSITDNANNFNAASSSRQTGAAVMQLGTSDSDALSALPPVPRFEQQANHIPNLVHMYDQHIDDLPFTDGYSDDDESSSDEQRYQHQHKHQHQHQHSNQRVEDDDDKKKRTRADESDLASKVIAMMADEMQKLRKENAKLRLKVKKLRKYKRARQDEEEASKQLGGHHHHEYHSSVSYPGSTHKRPRYDVVPPTQLPPQPPRAPSSNSASLAEARKHIPFLKHYDSLSNIIVSDIHTRPVLAFGFPTLDEPATLAYANEAFADMLQFSMDELRRLPLGAIISENPKMRDRLMPSFFDKEPWSVSEPIACCPLMRRKDGRTLRSTSNAQFFYGPTGLIRYGALVTLHWEEDAIREGEHFGNMIDRAILPPPSTQQHGYPTTQLPSSSSSSSSSHTAPNTAGAPSVTSRTFYSEEDVAGQASTNNYWERIIHSLAAPPQHSSAPLYTYGV